MKKIWIWIIVFAFMVAIGGLVWAGLRQATLIEEVGNELYTQYKKHYVMITGSDEGDFWDRIYESAKKEGIKRDIYVERFGSDLTVAYNKNELLNLAIQASVDGVIVPGDEEKETIRLINEAIERDMVVATVLSDSTGSLRQCFVGNSSYNMGREYGRLIQDILQEHEFTEKAPIKIVVLIDEGKKDTSQNLILLGIRESVEKNTEINAVVETIPIDNTRSYSSEEKIRDIFLGSEELPDILVCLNAVYTQCAYQAAVDYNQVGSVRILGYYATDRILNGVAKEIIDATLTLDTEQMGKLCVQALDELETTGYTSIYQTVDINLITKEKAAVLLKQQEEGVQ